MQCNLSCRRVLLLLGRDFNASTRTNTCSWRRRRLVFPSRRGGTLESRESSYREGKSKEFDVNKLVFGYTQQSDLCG